MGGLPLAFNLNCILRKNFPIYTFTLGYAKNYIILILENKSYST